MKSVILIVFLTFGGSVARIVFTTCGVDKCDHILSQEIKDVLRGHPPNEEELKNLCPPVLEALECAFNSISECTGRTNLEELLESNNETIALLVKFVLNVKKLTIDICSEDTKLHKNYVSHTSCFKDMIKNPNPKCREDAEKLYFAYRDTLKIADEEVNFQRMLKEGECMVNAYAIVCFATRLQENCGDVARETFLEIFVNRFEFLKLGACNEDDFLTLKTKFLDFLATEGEQRDLFISAFNFR